MISREQFRKLTVKYQTTELNTAREYLQHLFLSYFYELAQSGGIYFKGGTALKSSNLNFEVELKQFLPKTHWLIIKDFKQTLEREIERSM